MTQIAVRHASQPFDWTLLFRAFRDAWESVLDSAIRMVCAYPDEVRAIERVRTFMRARIAGRPAQLYVEDLLFTFVLVLATIDRDRQPVQYLSPP